MQPSDDVIERLRSLQEAVALEARLQEFVHGLMVQQHGKYPQNTGYFANLAEFGRKPASDSAQIPKN